MGIELKVRSQNRSVSYLAGILVLLTLGASSTAVNAATIYPALDNSAYILIDYDSGAVLAEKNANQPYPPASLTKLMTSYIIEQRLATGQLKENEPVMMTPEAWCHGRSTESCMYVPVNQTAPAIYMLKGIIIQSGNDAAVAMAQHIAGSESAFANLMNQEAKKIGMTNTHFVNATGLSTAGHQASAHDLAKLSQVIIKTSNKYYAIYGQKEFTYNGIKQSNRNSLLFSDPTVDGLKTGHTNEAGYCLAASSKRGDMRLISVILGTKSMQARAEQSHALLNWGFRNYTRKIVMPANQTTSMVPVLYGKTDSVNLVIPKALTVLVPIAEQTRIKTVIQAPNNVKAPVKQGQTVGKLVATLDGKAIASVPIITDRAIEQAGFFKRLWQQIIGFFRQT